MSFVIVSNMIGGYNILTSVYLLFKKINQILTRSGNMCYDRNIILYFKLFFMSFENPHEDLDPTNDLKKKAENPPGRNLDQTDIEKNKTDQKPEKSKDPPDDITKTLAL